MELYGKVNVPTKRKEYTGAKTETATTNVNNQSGVISVDVNLNAIKNYIDNYINSILLNNETNE